MIKHNTDGTNNLVGILSMLCLFLLYSVFILYTLYSFIRVYKQIIYEDSSTFKSRICFEYISNKVRQVRSTDSVFVEDFDGNSCLTIYDNNGYCNKIYCFDGNLMELYCERDVSLSASAGNKIIDVDCLKFIPIDKDIIQIDLQLDSGLHMRHFLKIAVEGNAREK